MNHDFDVVSAARNWRFKDVRKVSSDIAGEVFASDVLDMDELRELVSKPVWKSLQATMEKGTPLDPSIAAFLELWSTMEPSQMPQAAVSTR